MKSTFLLTTFFFINTFLFSQGGVDVNYIPIDSININYIGQKIKIDFKSTHLKEYLIQKARIRDTVKITINEKQIDLIEVKGTGVDYWYFDKEYLISYNYQQGLILKIEDIEIQKITTDSILFRMTLLLNEKTKKTTKQVSAEIKDIWISRSQIEGILIKS